MPPAVVDSPYLRPAEAAAYIRQSQKMLLRLRRAGALVPIRVSERKAVYHREDLDAFLASRRGA